MLWRVCICLCPFVCPRYMCGACVLSPNQYAGAPQQQYNFRRRVSSSCLRASSYGVRVFGWCTAGDRPTATTVSRPMHQSNTHGRTSDQVHEAYSSSQSSSFCFTISDFFFVCLRNGPHAYHWKGCPPPFRLATPLGYQVNPIRKGNLVYKCDMYISTKAHC